MLSYFNKTIKPIIIPISDLYLTLNNISLSTMPLLEGFYNASQKEFSDTDIFKFFSNKLDNVTPQYIVDTIRLIIESLHGRLRGRRMDVDDNIMLYITNLLGITDKLLSLSDIGSAFYDIVVKEYPTYKYPDNYNPVDKLNEIINLYTDTGKIDIADARKHVVHIIHKQIRDDVMITLKHICLEVQAIQLYGMIASRYASRMSHALLEYMRLKRNIKILCESGEIVIHEPLLHFLPISLKRSIIVAGGLLGGAFDTKLGGIYISLYNYLKDIYDFSLIREYVYLQWSGDYDRISMLFDLDIRHGRIAAKPPGLRKRYPYYGPSNITKVKLRDFLKYTLDDKITVLEDPSYDLYQRHSNTIGDPDRKLIFAFMRKLRALGLKLAFSKMYLEIVTMDSGIYIQHLL